MEQPAKNEQSLEDMLDPEEKAHIIERYFSENSDRQMVYQGDAAIYEGKPIASESFTRCSALIAISERSFSLSHVEPGDVRREIYNGFKKYFPKEEELNLTWISRDDSWPNDVGAHLSSSGWNIKDRQYLRFHQNNLGQRWEIAVDPTTQMAYVKFGFDDEITIKKLPLSNIYNHDLHEQSREKFESLDYMPPGFRDIQRMMEEENYFVRENDIEREITDIDITPQEWLTERKSDLKRALRIYHNGSMSEIDITSASTLRELMQQMNSGYQNVYLVEAMDYPPNEKYQGRNGFVFLYPVSSTSILNPGFGSRKNRF